VLSDFEGGAPVAAFGTDWLPSADDIAGGKSTGSVKLADGGASGTAKALLVSGTIDGSLPYAWYGAMWSPTPVPMQPANLSSKNELHFYAKGDGKPVRVMVFAQSKGDDAADADFRRRAGVAGAHDAVEIVRPRRVGRHGRDLRGRTGDRSVFVSGGRDRSPVNRLCKTFPRFASPSSHERSIHVLS
jgi:hypothetical protein